MKLMKEFFATLHLGVINCNRAYKSFSYENFVNYDIMYKENTKVSNCNSACKGFQLHTEVIYCNRACQ